MNEQQQAAMRQALDWYDNGNENREEFQGMIRQILEQQPADVPVAWQWLTTAHFRKRLPKNAENGAWNPLYASPPEQQEELQRLRALVRAQQITIEMEAQQQEPVVIVKTLPMGHNQPNMHFAECQHLPVGTPLYTSPPASKPWVGLTDEQIQAIAFEAVKDNWDWLKFARAIETKLREKNTGEAK